MRRPLAFFSFMLVSSTAVAFYCCDPWGLPMQQVFTQIGQSIADVIKESSKSMQSTLNQTLKQDLESGVAKTVLELGKQTAQQNTMAGGLLTTQQSAAAQTVVAEAAEQSKPAAQLETTVTNGIMSGEMESIVTDKIQAYDLAWSNTFLAAKSQDAGHAVIDRHQPYCAPEDVTSGLCQIAAIPALQNADLTINSIYQPGNGQYDTLSDQEHDAAIAFVQNITQPVAYVPPGKTMDGASTELSVLLAQDQATLSLVANSLHVQIAERTRRHE